MDRKADNPIFETWELTEDILSEKEPNVYYTETLVNVNKPKAKQMSKLINDK